MKRGFRGKNLRKPRAYTETKHQQQSELGMWASRPITLSLCTNRSYLDKTVTKYLESAVLTKAQARKKCTTRHAERERTTRVLLHRTVRCRTEQNRKGSTWLTRSIIVCLSIFHDRNYMSLAATVFLHLHLGSPRKRNREGNDKGLRYSTLAKVQLCMPSPAIKRSWT